jgi:hypothetical protein
MSGADYPPASRRVKQPLLLNIKLIYAARRILAASSPPISARILSTSVHEEAVGADKGCCWTPRGSVEVSELPSAGGAQAGSEASAIVAKATSKLIGHGERVADREYPGEGFSIVAALDSPSGAALLEQ